MARRLEAPLRLDLSDRRCRRYYLVLSHLLAALAPLLPGIGMSGRLGLLVLVIASAFHWWRRELFLEHPLALEWDEGAGWRLGYAGHQLPLSRLRHLVLGRCLLLETRGGQGTEVFFIRQRPGMNRLRHLLRR